MWVAGSKRLEQVKSTLAGAVRQSDFYWRFVENGKPWGAYQLHRPVLNDTQKFVLRNLKRDGIAITSVTELLGRTNSFEQLEEAVRELEKTTFSEDIQRARQTADTSGFKTYLIELLGPCPVLDPNDIFVRFALQAEVLNLANTYFGMY